MDKKMLDFVDTLPEATYDLLATVLREFLDAARKATDVSEVNVAAGIALERLR